MRLSLEPTFVLASGGSMPLSRALSSDSQEEAAVAEEVFSRVSHLAVGAHPDDLEILGIEGILSCHRDPSRGFFGVVATDGAGSVRAGPFEQMSDTEMCLLRRREQLAAARVGNYAGLALLGRSSAEVRDSTSGLAGELQEILGRAGAEVVYTHSPLDQHETHVAVCLAVVEALRKVPAERRPKQLLGCEVWGSLDFLEHPARRELDVSAEPHLQAALLGVFDSQIAGGKRYDLATLGRRRAQATFRRPREVDQASGVVLALDLLPLLTEPTLEVGDYVERILRENAAVAVQRIRRLGRE